MAFTHWQALHNPVCTTLKHTVPYCTALHHTTLHCTMLHCTALCCNVLHQAALHCTTLEHTTPHRTTSHLSSAHLAAPERSAPQQCGSRGRLSVLLGSTEESREGAWPLPAWARAGCRQGRLAEENIIYLSLGRHIAKVGEVFRVLGCSLQG